MVENGALGICCNEGDESYVSHDASVADSRLLSGSCVYRRAMVTASVIGDYSTVGDDSVVQRCRMGDRVSINRRNYIHDSEFDGMTYTGRNVTVHCARIGKCVSIASNVEIGAAGHDMSHVSLMPAMMFEYAKTGRYSASYDADLKIKTEVGGDVWIGSGAIILGGVRIGDGAVIGAGAVVTHDVEPFSVVAGVPARVLRYRFPPELAERLRDVAWWTWDTRDIARHSDALSADLDESVLDVLEEAARRIRSST